MAAKIEAAKAIAVFCGSSFGSQKAYQLAAVSLGKALAGSHRPLVFGATNNGIMGILSSTVREAGGNIVGITPYAMVAAGGEEQKAKGASLVDIDLAVEKNVQEELILVESMHDRKREMAQRSCGFVALPGGFGTMEEVLEVTTWTQIGIHQKPVVVLNVLGFYNHLRQLVRHAVRTGFISPDNERLITFVNGPGTTDPDTEPSESEIKAHESFDWGSAALEAIDRWSAEGILTQTYDWSLKVPPEDDRKESVAAT